MRELTAIKLIGIISRLQASTKLYLDVGGLLWNMDVWILSCLLPSVATNSSCTSESQYVVDVYDKWDNFNRSGRWTSGRWTNYISKIKSPILFIRLMSCVACSQGIVVGRKARDYAYMSRRDENSKGAPCSYIVLEVWSDLCSHWHRPWYQITDNLAS